MKRTVLLLALGVTILSLSGCSACKKMFGLDKRCEQPPPSYSNAQPVFQNTPANFAPAPACNAPR
jgi:hypothetical protein